MACILEYGHNMSVATWFTSVLCIGFTVLSSNEWADLVASRVSPFMHQECKAYGEGTVRIYNNYNSSASSRLPYIPLRLPLMGLCQYLETKTQEV